LALIMDISLRAPAGCCAATFQTRCALPVAKT
jgi:hypothetical protein